MWDQVEEEWKEKAKNHPGTTYVILPGGGSTTTGEKLTIEKLRKLPVIFVHPDFHKVQERVLNTLDKACGGLSMLWTSHTPIMWNVFEKEIKKSNALFTKGNYPGAFCQLCGTVYVKDDSDDWWNDVEETKPVEKLMTSVKATLTKLFTKTDDELALHGDQPREKVVAVLKKWGERVLQSGNEYNFDWY